MQPCSREMAAMNSLLNPLQDLQSQQQQQTQIQNTHHFDPSAASNDDFFEQMLSNLPSCSWSDLKSPWVDLNPTPNLTMPINSGSLRDLSDETAPDGSVGFHNFDESAILASKLRQHRISGGSAGKLLMQQQQQLMMSGNQGEGMLNGFGGGGSMQVPNHTQQHFQGTMQPLSFNAQAGVTNQPQASGGSSGGAPTPAQPKQRVRARRGQATDPHSIAERLRRERIAERMKALQELVPNANKTDKASMLDEIIDYVKFLQLQVKVLSMSRLGGAAAVAPLVADMSSEGNGGDCIQANSNGAPLPRASNQTPSSTDSLTVTEHQVAKLMEEDMGSAMQYLQGKGLCLMPISLVTAISTATCHNRNSVISNNATSSNNVNNHHQALLQSNGEGPTSPSMSVLTVQSATMGNGITDVSVRDAASVSKP